MLIKSLMQTSIIIILWHSEIIYLVMYAASVVVFTVSNMKRIIHGDTIIKYDVKKDKIIHNTHISAQSQNLLMCIKPTKNHF